MTRLMLTRLSAITPRPTQRYFGPHQLRFGPGTAFGPRLSTDAFKFHRRRLTLLHLDAVSAHQWRRVGRGDQGHFPYFDDVPAEIASRIFHVTQQLSRALKSLYRVRQVAFVFTGSDIPHTHGHIVPMHEKTNITSRLYIAEEHLTFRYVAQAPVEERAVIAEQIRAMLPVS